MCQPKYHCDWQNGRKRSYLLHQKLKRVSAKNHLFADRRDEQGGQIKHEGEPGEVGALPRNQVSGSRK